MNTINKFVLSLLLFTSSFTVFSQASITSKGKQFLFKNYTTQNGLIDNTILAMEQDKHRFL